MIVLDIETSGGNSVENGIWQIGAFELENPENIFLQECRIDEEDRITEESLRIIEKTEKDLRDENKQSQKQLISNFLEWAMKIKYKNLLCHNPQFDQTFIKNKTIKYWRKDPFFEKNLHKAFDLHTIAQMKFYEINKKFSNEEDSSNMGLRNILKFCGIEDHRKTRDNEGSPHNALEDAKLTGECFNRIVYGKNLFPEFSKFPIPDKLKK